LADYYFLVVFFRRDNRSHHGVL